MAVSGQTLTNLAYALKYTYQPEIRDLTFSKSPTMDQITKTDVSDQIGEGLIRYSRARTSLGWNTVAATTSGGYFPSPRSVGGVRPYIAMKCVQTSVGFTRDALLVSKSPASVVNVGEEEMTRKKQELHQFQELGLWSGHYGHMGRVNSTATSGTTRQLDLYTSSAASQHPAPHQILQAKMRLDSYDAVTGGTIGLDSVTYESATTAGVITLSAASTENCNNDYLFFEDSYSYMPNNFVEYVDNYALATATTSSAFGDNAALLTVMGLSRSAYPYMEANVVHNSGTVRALTTALIERAADTAVEYGRPECTHIFGSLPIRRAYIKLREADTRFTENFMVINGGWKATEYSHGQPTPIPMIWVRNMPSNAMYFLNMPAFEYMVFSPFEFDSDRDGAMMHFQTDSTGTMNAYVAYGDLWYNLACHDFQAQTVLRDIDISGVL